MPETENRKLAVIMFTDMVGYTALTEKDETIALELLDKHNQLVRSFLYRHGGREVKTIGDAFLVEFSSVLEAVRCAIEIQNTMAEYNALADSNRQFWLRIGIHLGDVVYRGGDVFGDGVNIASRIEGHSDAGGICFSEDVYNQIRTHQEFHVDFIGVHELKNVSTPMPLYKVLLGTDKPGERRKRARPPKSRPNWLVPVLVTSVATPLLLVLLGSAAWLAFNRAPAKAVDANTPDTNQASLSPPAQPKNSQSTPPAPASNPDKETTQPNDKPATTTKKPIRTPSISSAKNPSSSATTTSRRKTGNTTLQLRGSHSFQRGTLYILVDDQLLKMVELTSAPNSESAISENIPVEPGEHRLEIRVRATRDGFDKSATSVGRFEPRQTRTLAVSFGQGGRFLGFGKRSKKINLVWAD